MRRILAVIGMGLVITVALVVTAASRSGVQGQAPPTDANLLKYHGVEVRAAPLDQGPTISADRARAIAIQAVPLIGQSGVSGETKLVLMTDHHYGPVVNDKVIPKFAARLAWQIEFSGVEMPVLGPHTYQGPAMVKQSVVAFVDATTGEFMEVVTL